MNEDEKKMIELMEHRAMICLPEDAVRIAVNCEVYHDGEIISVTKTLDMKEIREAFRKADDGYIDDEDTFTLTEAGKAYLDEHRKDQ